MQVVVERSDIDGLKARIIDLEFQVMCLRSEILGKTEFDDLPREWGLTLKEDQIFRTILSATGVATRDRILTALYFDRGDAEPNQKILDVFICKLRKKLEPFQIKIRTVWGRGWEIDAEVKAQLRKKPAAVAMKAAA